MTTVLGLKHQRVDLAVLVADRQTTLTSPGREEKYLEGRKLWLSKDKMFALGHSGNRNTFNALIKDIESGKIDIKKAITDKKFNELREINMAGIGTEDLNTDKLSSFLLISRYGKKACLYKCYPFGDVVELTFDAIGSGSVRVREYVGAQDVLGQAKSYLGSGRAPHAGDIIQYGLEAVRYAQGKDIYSSGLDLIAMRPGRTFDCFADLQDDFQKKMKQVQKRVGK